VYHRVNDDLESSSPVLPVKRFRKHIDYSKQAKKMGLKTIALTGGDGGELAKIAETSLLVPSLITARIQEAHITIGHIICELVEQVLCQEEK
jgi:DNA-binding MurR/RpiR family transcriptional regulator